MSYDARLTALLLVYAVVALFLIGRSFLRGTYQDK